MADTGFDWSQHEIVDGAPPAMPSQPAAQSPEPEKASGFDWGQFEAQANQGDRSKPAYVRGVTPDTAIPQSPLTATERLELKGFGSTATGMNKYLSERFDKVVMDKESGDFRVKSKDGLWYQIDPNTLEGADPYKATVSVIKGLAATAAGTVASPFNMMANAVVAPFVKGQLFDTNPLTIAEALVKGDPIARETVGEAAENLDTAVLTAAGVLTAPVSGAASGATLAGRAGYAAAQALKAAGPSALASAASKLGLTSMGKLVGTYDLPPEEQLKEAGFEGLLSMGGVVVPAGVRFGAREVVATKAAQAVSNTLQKVSTEKLALVKATFGRLAGLPEEAFDRLATAGNKVQEFISAKAGTTYDQFADGLNLSSAEDIQTMAKVARRGISEAFDGVYKGAIELVPDNLRVSTRDITHPIFDELVTNGMAVRNEAGEIALKSFDDMQKAAVSGGMKKTKLADVAFDRETYSFLSELVDTMKTMSDVKGLGLRGKEAAEAVINVSKKLKNITMKAAKSGEEAANNDLYTFASKLGRDFQTAVPNAFESAGAKDVAAALGNANKAYGTMLEESASLLKAANDPAHAARLVNSISSKARGQFVNRTAVTNTMKTLSEFGGSAGKSAANVMGEMLDRVSDRNAAIAFTAPLKSSWGPLRLGNVLTTGTAAVVGGLAGDPISGAGAGAAAAGTLAVLSNPRVAKFAAQNALKFNAMLKNIPTEKVAETLANSDILEMGARSIFQAPVQRDQTREQLLQQAGIQPEQAQ